VEDPYPFPEARQRKHTTHDVGLGLWPLSIVYIMRGVHVPYIEVSDPSGAKHVFAHITLTRVT
jgi:hypothetical protein